ncbi:Sucrose synthase 2 [Glycine soja]|uniref:sucrose synthase n=1 Tax=Glycine soja TaxID=3848 RepID=A0A445GZ05_GLYSO|nr:Sucrose synthase 2 [Glycine soja]
MEPGSAAPYLTLAHIYARKALWNEVAEVRRLMQQRRITEPAGWSWVDDSTIFVRTLKSDVDVVNVLITLYVKCGDANTARLDGFQPNQEIHLLPLLSLKPEDTSLEFNSRDLLFCLKDAIFLPPFVAIPVRPRPGVWEYVHNNVSDLSVEQLSISEYLCFKEELVDGKINDNLYWSLTLSHLMPHFLAHSTSHTLAMVSNFLIATFHQLCFATKIPCGPCLISSELTNTRAIL